MKKFFLNLSVAIATLVALVASASGNALMAVGLAATDSQSGNDVAGSAQLPNGGADGGGMTVSQGQQVAGEGGDGLYVRDVEETVMKIDTMSTPLLQISSYASNSSVGAQEFEYWSVGPRIGRTTVPTGGVTMATANKSDRFILAIDDPGFVTKDDTIRVVGYKGYKDGSSTAATGNVNLFDGTVLTGQAMGDGAEDLVLFVINVQEDTGYPVCICVNGPASASPSKTSNPFKLPFNLAAGTVLVRMGKSCGELDAQTGRFHNYPEPEIQYTQNFMFQVEQSTFDKMTDKKVKWDFNDIEEAGIRDMKIAQENTYLFGKKKKIRHPNKENMNQYFTGGLWWMAGKDIEIGHEEAVKDAEGNLVYVKDGEIVDPSTSGATVLKETVIKDDDLVDFAREMFVGAAGNKKKVMLCGSQVLAKFGQIRSDRFRLKETVDVWNLTFSRFHTDFGDILVIYDEQLDMNGMSAYAFCIDPEYLKKKTFLGLTRNVLELKKAGLRNSDAVTLQEVAGIYLTYADAHARVQLAGNGDKLDWGTAEAFDFYVAKNSVPPKKKSYAGTDKADDIAPNSDVVS